MSFKNFQNMFPEGFKIKTIFTASKLICTKISSVFRFPIKNGVNGAQTGKLTGRKIGLWRAGQLLSQRDVSQSGKTARLTSGSNNEVQQSVNCKHSCFEFSLVLIYRIWQQSYTYKLMLLMKMSGMWNFCIVV